MFGRTRSCQGRIVNLIPWLAAVCCAFPVCSAEVDRNFLPELKWRNGPYYGAMVVLAVQADGRILVGGDFSDCNGQPVGRMVRLERNGEIDESFRAPEGVLGVDEFTFGQDGFIYVRGTFAFEGRTSRVDRISYTGVRDANFHGRGASLPSGFAVDQSGRITLAGGFSEYLGTTAYLARLLPGGEVDPSFQPHTRPSAVLSLCGGGVYLLPAGKILVAGLFPGVGPYSWTIQRLLPDGAPDPAFIPDSEVIGGIVFGAHIQRNGQIVFTDNHWDGVKRLNADGSADNRFKQRATAGSGLTVLNYAVGPDYRIYTVSGPDAGGQGQKRLDRLNRGGTVDGSFDQGAGPSAWVDRDYRMIRATVEKDGGLLVYGTFRAFDGVQCSGLLRLKTDLVKTIVASEMVNGKLRVTAVGGESEFAIEESIDFTSWKVAARGQFVENEGEVDLPMEQAGRTRSYRLR